MSQRPPILRVAVPTPVRGLFDYLAPGDRAVEPGTRVRVDFGRRRLVGVVVECARESAVPAARLRPVQAVLDEAPLLSARLLDLGCWTARYYHQPVGEVFAAMLPVLLRRGEPPEVAGERAWSLAPGGHTGELDALSRAPRQRALVEWLRAGARDTVTAADLDTAFSGWRQPARRLVEKGWLEERMLSCLAEPPARTAAPPALNADQAAAAGALREALGGFAAFLLEGVTGSGKTEVYLDAVDAALGRGRQVLVLVPEIALTPQLVGRFRARVGVPVAMLHSALNARERLCGWNAARTGEARVVLGTRSAVFVPLAEPGLIIVDEEHDASFKQQDGVRYNARDLAAMRARSESVPVVFGSATPSLESLANALAGRYRRLHLGRRAGAARPPRVELLDVRRRPLVEGLAAALIERMEAHLGAGGQVMVFINRRGFAPQLICHECGWVPECRRCDAPMTYHRRRGELHCHHCGAERPAPTTCEGCGAEALMPLGQGTERVEAALGARFPEFEIERIDRDTTRRKGSLEASLERARSGEARILVGTQMLAKGHDFPGVTLVGILDADRGLFGVDFRAAERVAQLVVQVAGRAGRGERPGEVVIQTHHPEHPLLRTLVGEGYGAFARSLLEERREAALPPHAHFCLVRAEAPAQAPPRAFLQAAREALPVECRQRVLALGPVKAPLERIAGRYRMQLLLQAGSRADLHAALDRWLPAVEALPEARRIRWSVDVDPQDMS